MVKKFRKIGSSIQFVCPFEIEIVEEESGPTYSGPKVCSTNKIYPVSKVVETTVDQYRDDYTLRHFGYGKVTIRPACSWCNNYSYVGHNPVARYRWYERRNKQCQQDTQPY